MLPAFGTPLNFDLKFEIIRETPWKVFYNCDEG
jgi:hypothetical protein